VVRPLSAASILIRTRRNIPLDLRAERRRAEESGTSILALVSSYAPSGGGAERSPVSCLPLRAPILDRQVRTVHQFRALPSRCQREEPAAVEFRETEFRVPWEQRSLKKSRLKTLRLRKRGASCLTIVILKLGGYG